MLTVHIIFFGGGGTEEVLYPLLHMQMEDPILVDIII